MRYCISNEEYGLFVYSDFKNSKKKNIRRID